MFVIVFFCWVGILVWVFELIFFVVNCCKSLKFVLWLFFNFKLIFVCYCWFFFLKIMFFFFGLLFWLILKFGLVFLWVWNLVFLRFLKNIWSLKLKFNIFCKFIRYKFFFWCFILFFFFMWFFRYFFVGFVF